MASRWTGNLRIAYPDSDIKSIDFNENFKMAHDAYIALENEYDTTKDDVAKAKTDLSGALTTIGQLTTDLNTTKTDAATALANAAQASTIANQAQTTANSNSTSIGNINTEITAARGSYQTLNARISAIDLNPIYTQLSTLNSEYSGLSSEVETARSTYPSLNDRLNDLTAGSGSGTPGADGATWLNGAIDPAANIGSNNDYYINTASYDIFQKQSGVWVKIGNLKGAIPFPDTPPTTPTQWDDEFNSTTLDSKWTVTSTNIISHDINASLPSCLSAVGGSSAGYFELMEAFAPGSSDFQLRGCFYGMMMKAYQGIGLQIYDALSVENGIKLWFENDGSNPVADLATCTSGTWTYSQFSKNIYGNGKFYLHVQRRGGGIWDFYFSLDGHSWTPITTGYSKAFTVNYIGFILNHNTSGLVSNFACDWIRINPGVLPY